MSAGTGPRVVPLADVVVPASAAGTRLDQVLPALAPGLSRGQARRLIDGGSVFVDGQRARVCSRPVRGGEHVVAWPLHVSCAGAAPTVVLRADGLAVIDKPAGMAMEPTRSGVHGTLAGWLRARGLPSLVTHRLDAATSGLVAVAGTTASQAELNRLFAAHLVRRRYLAAVAPAPPWPAAVLDEPLDGREARSRVTVAARAPGAALVVVDLDTGRTRQIRRHLAHAGFPVIGDRSEGGRPGARLLLHAFALEVPRGGATLSARAAPGPDFAAEALRWGFDGASLQAALVAAGARTADARAAGDGGPVGDGRDDG